VLPAVWAQMPQMEAYILLITAGFNPRQ